ncbi:MAG: lipid II flippase MurJ, partial [Bacillota bacterium]
NQINLAMNRYFASFSLPPGSITALDYANRVMNLPLGIFAAAVATVAFPAMAAKGAAEDWRGFGEEFSTSFRLMSFTMLPAGVGLLVLREPVVRLLFERKAFTPEATLMTSQALLYFCLGLWFLGALYLLTRAYYSLGDLKTPAMVGLIAIIANGIFSVFFINWLGHRGLALANSLAAGVNGVLLFYLLKRRVPRWRPRVLLIPLAKMLLATALMGAGVNFAHLFIGSFSSFWLEAGLVLALALLGVVIYALAVLLLKVEEAGRILKMFKH